MTDDIMEGVAEETVGNEEAEDKRVFTNIAGEECSQAAFVREQFTELNKSRAEISKEFDIPYRAVYGATVNMTNDAPPTARGRSSASIQIELEDGTKVNRKDYIKQLVEEGKSRGEIADALDISYQAVYAATKDLEVAGGRGGRVMVTLEDGSEVSRTEFVKTKFAEGMERKDIVKLLNEMEVPVTYQAVYNATSEKKEKPFISITANTLEELEEAYAEAKAAIEERDAAAAEEETEE